MAKCKHTFSWTPAHIVQMGKEAEDVSEDVISRFEKLLIKKNCVCVCLLACVRLHVHVQLSLNLTWFFFHICLTTGKGSQVTKKNSGPHNWQKQEFVCMCMCVVFTQLPLWTSCKSTKNYQKDCVLEQHTLSIWAQDTDASANLCSMTDPYVCQTCGYCILSLTDWIWAARLAWPLSHMGDLT